jgi:hypothetical protein
MGFSSMAILRSHSSKAMTLHHGWRWEMTLPVPGRRRAGPTFGLQRWLGQAKFSALAREGTFNSHPRLNSSRLYVPTTDIMPSTNSS